MENYKSATPIEKMIYDAILNSVEVLSKDNSAESVLAYLISDIAAITGYLVNQEQSAVISLIKQLKTHLQDFGFSELTYDEILLAFRINSLGNIKYPSGFEKETIYSHSSYLSVMYISKILLMYLDFKKLFFRNLENSINGY